MAYAISGRLPARTEDAAVQFGRGALHEGRLVRWDQERGFGFIRPNDGGKDVFVHVTGLGGQDRPRIGSTWLFSAAPDPDGRGLRVVKAVPRTDDAGSPPLPRARAETGVRQREQPRTAPAARQSYGARGRPRPADRPRRPPGRARDRSDQTLVALPLGWRTWLVASATLFCLVAAATTFGKTGWALGVYPVMSLFACFVYARDKLMALRGGWRVPEASLHIVEMLGGWPGAYWAQQTMRHKTVKSSYQAAYWTIVLLHVAAWSAWLMGPRSLVQLLAP